MGRQVTLCAGSLWWALHVIKYRALSSNVELEANVDGVLNEVLIGRLLHFSCVYNLKDSSSI